MNTNLQTLISMQQTSEATSALQLVGSTVTVGGQIRDAIQCDRQFGHLESDGSLAGDREPHNHQFVRADRLYRHDGA